MMPETTFRRWAAVVIPEIVLCEGPAIIFLATARAANRTNRIGPIRPGAGLIGPVNAEISAPDRRQPSWETRTDPECLVGFGPLDLISKSPRVGTE